MPFTPFSSHTPGLTDTKALSLSLSLRCTACVHFTPLSLKQKYLQVQFLRMCRLYVLPLLFEHRSLSSPLVRRDNRIDQTELYKQTFHSLSRRVCYFARYKTRRQAARVTLCRRVLPEVPLFERSVSPFGKERKKAFQMRCLPDISSRLHSSKHTIYPSSQHTVRVRVFASISSGISVARALTTCESV